MILNGKVIVGNRVLFEKSVQDACPDGSDFRDKLENCLLTLCKEADIAVPIWLTKNSRELGRFGKTSFLWDQFAETVRFERFEIKILER